MKTREYIGPESKPVTDDQRKKQKDTTGNQAQAVKMGESTTRGKKKKGIFNKIFGKKYKKGN